MWPKGPKFGEIFKINKCTQNLQFPKKDIISVFGVISGGL